MRGVSLENPYWHGYRKPHFVDFEEIAHACFEGFSILAASRSFTGVEGEEIGGVLHETFFELSERTLSSVFLRLAMYVRTYEDAISESEISEPYKKFISELSDVVTPGDIGFEGSTERKDISLREACNKIIHAEDFRPTYDNGSNPRDEDFGWGMTGMIELMGRLRGKRWNVWLDAEEFLSQCLEVSKWAEQNHRE